MNEESSNTIAFAVGTGRCGSKFLYKLLDSEPQVSAVHERNALNETFHRYCKWYGLNIDHEGFLSTKEKEIRDDLSKSKLSFEASAFLSLSIHELYDRFNSKFIFLVRSPDKVVNSYLTKGWYKKSIERKDPNLPPSYQESKYFHHFLGRIIPSGPEYTHWNNLTRVGKLSWYWNQINNSIYDQLKDIPRESWIIQRLEDLDYSQYNRIISLLNIQSKISKEEYDLISKNRPNHQNRPATIKSWGHQERIEFKEEVKPMAKLFKYPYDVEEILANNIDKDYNATLQIDKRNINRFGNLLRRITNR